LTTSKLQRYISNKLLFNNISFVENTRPEWLVSERGTRLELDFYIQEKNIAIEVQGEQHYVYVPYFHKSHDGFRKRLADDTRKRIACISYGVRLIYVRDENEADEAVYDVISGYRKRNLCELYSVLSLVPVGKSNDRLLEGLQAGIDTATKIANGILKSDDDKLEEYLTKKRKRSLIGAVINIAARGINHLDMLSDYEIELVRTACVFGATFYEELNC